MHTINVTLRGIAAFFGFCAMALLPGCGGSSAPAPAAATAPVAWNVGIPSTPLTAQQQAALTSGLALLAAGDYNGAINAITRLRSEVEGINTEVEAALGQSFGARSRLTLSAYRSEAVARTAGTGTSTVTVTASDVALYALTTFAPGRTNDLALVDGNVALQLMVPAGTAASALPEARQAEVGMIATVQFLRLVAQVVGNNSLQVTDAQITAAVAARYDDGTRLALNRAALLLTATNAALRTQVNDGLVVSLPGGLAAVLADGNITPAELTSLLTAYKA